MNIFLFIFLAFILALPGLTIINITKKIHKKNRHIVHQLELLNKTTDLLLQKEMEKINNE